MTTQIPSKATAFRNLLQLAVTACLTLLVSGAVQAQTAKGLGTMTVCQLLESLPKQCGKIIRIRGELRTAPRKLLFMATTAIIT